MKLFVPILIWLHILYQKRRARLKNYKVASDALVLLPIYSYLIYVDIVYVIARTFQRLSGLSYYGIHFAKKRGDQIRADSAYEAALFICLGEGISTFWLFLVFSFLVSPSAGKYALRHACFRALKFSGLYCFIYGVCISSHVSRNTYWMMKLMSTVIVCYFLYSVLITMQSLRCPRWGVWFHLAVWGTALLWSAYIAVCIVAMSNGPELFYTIMSYIALVFYDFLQPIFVYMSLINDSHYWRNLEKYLIPTKSFTLSDRLLDEDSMRISPRTGHLNDTLLSLNVPLIDFMQLISDHSILGIGGYAVVWKCYYRGEPVAVKEFKQERMSVETIREFCREALLSAKIEHENILKFHGVCVAPPEFLMVFDWCSCGDLGKYLMTNLETLSYHDRLKLALQAICGMSFFHQHGLVHRDIKPQNFLVHSEAGRIIVKLADFGSCRSRYDAMPIFKGISPMFASPEIRKYIPEDWKKMDKTLIQQTIVYGPETDVFSFGWVLWGIFFTDSNWKATLKPHYRDIMQGWFPSLIEFNPLICGIIMQCWSLEPSHRPSANIVQFRLEKGSSMKTKSAQIIELQESLSSDRKRNSFIIQ